MMPTLPLGIDLGARRVRVALSVRHPDGSSRLLAVAASDRADEPVRAIREAVAELRTRERRCVLGVTTPDAMVRAITLPPMSRFERGKAAAFQAARFIDYPVSKAALSLRAEPGTDRWVLGIARRDAIQARVNAAKRARLVPLAVDDTAFALERALGEIDGTLDITDTRTRLTLFAQPVPYVAAIPIGGFFLTEGIARSLGIDAAAAEERKRTIGFAGAGETQRDSLIEAIGELLAQARDAGHRDVRALALVGNGSRIPGFAELLARACSYAIAPASLAPQHSEALPPDVLRAAAADWSIAFGLSLWAA